VNVHIIRIEEKSRLKLFDSPFNIAVLIKLVSAYVKAYGIEDYNAAGTEIIGMIQRFSGVYDYVLLPVTESRISCNPGCDRLFSQIIKAIF